MDYYEIDWGFWVKFVLVSLVVVILPVWVVKLIEISFLYRILFTLAGFVGVWLALQGKTLRNPK
ncbi:hypothetical protein LCGC14_2276020 [marine sediment metagenome]|uniref:Uncharacterized protein n=1 Tax=marine sediment metagenome TaxID=412755 RepID=A0A0F9DHS9_9ZZZZ